jgi:hypothetical protein
MKTTVSVLVGASLVFASGPTFGQRAVLSHGDPTVTAASGPEHRSDRKEENREQRLKQQGQGPNYRIEGNPQSGRSYAPQTEKGSGPGLHLQDTGVADPRVNPGQAEGSRR